MKFNCSNNSLKSIKSDCIVAGIMESNLLSNTAAQIDHISNGYITNILNKGEINGEIGQYLLLYNLPNINSERILLIGCGKKNNLNDLQYEQIFKKIIKIINNTNAKIIECFLTELSLINKNTYWKIRQAIEIINEINYEFHQLKSNFFKKKNKIQEFNFNINPSTSEKENQAKLAIQHSEAINIGIKHTKDLSNLPANICNPKYLSILANQLNEEYSEIKTTIINEAELKNLKMYAYLAVGQGSNNESFMSVIEYKGINNEQIKPIVLIGKGLTFDSGGISLKSANNMDEMKFDMCGAATLYGIMHFIAILKLPINVISILACAENMPSGNSYRPGDIITTMSGKTVEIINTDAEGRLVLCDVLTYIERFNPDIVIDIATLTGACIIALGKHYSGLISNDEKLSKEIIDASIESRDKVWRLPLDKLFYEQLKSEFADISHVGGRDAGTITAGCFLEIFAHKYRWAHLDIAGTAWNSGVKKKATGRPLKLIAQFLLNRSINNVK